MKNRSELFSIFKSLFAEIQNQFSVSIRTFRSDNTLEYLSSQFQQFMSHHGIIHHHTLLNKIVSQKERMTARTLLIKSHVPCVIGAMQSFQLVI